MRWRRSVLKTETAADARLTMVFRLATRRHPRADEMAALREYYAAQLQRYGRGPRRGGEAARRVGVTPAGRDASTPCQLAALTNVTTVVMNTPDAYSLR